MSIILTIDTSTETAIVCVAEDGRLLDSINNLNQKDHAVFLQNAVKDITQRNRINLNSLSAMAVSNGPGSYTGLRVGMASAKGLCYALGIPLVTLSTLHVMANAVIQEKKNISTDSFLYVPLIDARRMEIYTAVFDEELNQISEPEALILNENSFKDILKIKSVYFFGSGSQKFQAILNKKNAFFTDIKDVTFSIARLSFEKFIAEDFADLAKSQPFYLKEFHSSSPDNNKG